MGLEMLKAVIGKGESFDEFQELIQQKKEIWSKNLTEEQINFIENINYEDNLDKTIKAMDKKDISVAISIGVIAALLAVIIDSNGENFENALNKIKIKKGLDGKPTNIGKLDLNNVFDIKKGANHRYYMLHDLNAFQNIPGDFVIPNGMSLEELMGGNQLAYKAIDVMKKFYKLDNDFKDYLPKLFKVLGIHLVKDLVTEDGLPIPFSSFLTKFTKNFSNACNYSNSNMLYSNLYKELCTFRLSDITSIIIMKAIINIYIKSICNNEEISKKSKKMLKNQINIVANSTVIIIQLFILLYGKNLPKKKYVSGGRLNIILSGDLISNYNLLFKSLNNSNKSIINVYKNKRVINRGVFMENRLIEFTNKADEDYFFENDKSYYISEETLNKALSTCLCNKKLSEKDAKQLKSIYSIELLKSKLANNKILVHEYRLELVKELKEFSNSNGFTTLENRKILKEFYKVINNLVRGE